MLESLYEIQDGGEVLRRKDKPPVTNSSKGHRLSRWNGFRNNENENPLPGVDEN